MYRKFILIFIAVICLNGSESTAEVYDSTSVGLSYISNTSRELYHLYWEAPQGFDLSIRTKFYTGYLELGGSYTSHKSRFSDQADFKAYYPYFGWMHRSQVNDRIRFWIGPRVGSFIMSFADGQVNVEGKNELELGIELFGSAELDLFSKFALELSLRHRVIYTRQKIEFTFIAAGIRYDFETPGWLRGFFR